LLNLHYTETELLTGLQQHDEQAYQFLYDNYSKSILIVIKQIISQQEIAEDVLQEAFIKVWQNIHTYDVSKGRLYTWMISIARNLAIDRTRSKEFTKQNKTESIQDNVYITGNTEESNISDSGLRKVLTALPSDNARLIDLAYFKGFTQEEISKIMMIPIGTVKTRMRSAISFLRNKLKPNE